MAAGLSWGKARAICMEEALCLLHHLDLDDTLAALEQESDRIASLVLVDEESQHKRLAALELRARGLVDRFYKAVGEE